MGARRPPARFRPWIWRVGRRFIPSRHEPAGILERVADGVDDVEPDRGEPEDHQEHDDRGRQRHQLLDVGVVAHALARRDPLVAGDGDVAAVEGQQRDQVEDGHEDVDHHQDGQELEEAALGRLSAMRTTPTTETGRASAVLASTGRRELPAVVASEPRARRTSRPP